MFNKKAKNLRILLVGEDWHGSNATSFKRALRFLGCDVLNINEWHYYPQWLSLHMKSIRRVLLPLIVYEFEKDLLRKVNLFKPDLLFVFKGVMVRNVVLQSIKKLGVPLFIFYPDVDLHLHYRQFRNNFIHCIPEYDCIFTPKSYHISSLKKYGGKHVEFLPYAYDPWCHYPIPFDERDKLIFKSDIAFIGTWGDHKARLLERLVSGNFNYNLIVWGNQWNKLSRNSPLRKYIKFSPATGETQGKIFRYTKIALAFLSPPDLHTARTFEIPAFGAFMLAERTIEHTNFFCENKEIVCFDDLEELRHHIDYFMENEDRRNAIAHAGYVRVTNGGHSYVDRMKKVLKIYQEIFN